MTKKNALIISSDGIAALEFKNVLIKNGYKILKIAQTGEEGLELSDKLNPDFIIIDTHLKGRIDAITAINQISAKHTIPLVITTSENELNAAKAINKRTSTNILIKPVQKDILIYTIENSILQVKLYKNDKKYYNLFNSVADPILIFRKDNYKILDCNKAFLKRYGYTKSQLIKMTPFNLHPEEELEIVKQRINMANREYEFEYHHITKTGDILDVSITSDEILYDGKEAFISIIHNITTRIKNENKIKKQAFEAELIFNIGKKLSRKLDCELLLKETVDSIKNQFNYYGVLLLLFDKKRENLVLKAISGEHSKVFPAKMKININEGLIGKAARTGVPILCRDVSKNKDYINTSNEKTKSELSVPIISNKKIIGVIDIQSNKLNAFSEEDEKVIETISSQVAIALDNAKLYNTINKKLAEQKKTAAILRKTQQETDRIFNTAIDGIIVIDRQFKIYKINDSLLKQLNISREKAIGAKCHALIRSSICNTLKCPIYQISDKNVQYTQTGVIVHAPDKELKCTISSSAFYSAEGRLNGIVSSFHDITEYMEMQTKLIQAEKLQSIGQLASGIAHEINTPIQYVGDNVRFFKDSYKNFAKIIEQTENLCESIKSGGDIVQAAEKLHQIKDEAGLDFLINEIPTAIDQTLDGVARISKIVSAMKDFSHPGETEKSLNDINRAIETTVTIARNRWKYVADIDLQLDEWLPPVPCYIDEFNQVILNLIVNAADAIADKIGSSEEKKGKITIKTKPAGNYIEISIKDTGTGIPEKVKDKVFDPFFTTKEVGKGTGQGLAISYSVIVEKHKGSIGFVSVPGEGTEFKIKLPIDS
ncbi:PAS domain S-box protein [bacterium]|nr:PAS domain S-box protein [bacterium]